MKKLGHTTKNIDQITGDIHINTDCQGPLLEIDGTPSGIVQYSFQEPAAASRYLRAPSTTSAKEFFDPKSLFLI